MRDQPWLDIYEAGGYMSLVWAGPELVRAKDAVGK